jgi:hypothetical protein
MPIINQDTGSNRDPVGVFLRSRKIQDGVKGGGGRGRGRGWEIVLVGKSLDIERT